MQEQLKLSPDQQDLTRAGAGKNTQCEVAARLEKGTQ